MGFNFYKSKVKILHIEDWFHPEMGYQLNFISKYHSPIDEMIILTSNSFLLWSDSDANNIQNLDQEFELKNNVKIIRLPVKFARPRKYNIWLCNLKKTILEINPDVIYFHGFETITSFRIMFSSLSRKLKIFSDTHTLLNQFDNSFSTKMYLFFVKNFLAKRANKRNLKIFSTTLENKNILIEKFGINPENVFESAIGTDTHQYYFDEEEKLKLRKSIGINENELVVLYTGKFNFTKQPHLILEAFKIIENEIQTPVNLVFVGSKNEDYFNQYFNFHFENENIKMQILPSVNSKELFKYYSMADFAVFPKENTLSALDAQSCKLPIIMEDDITNAERLKEGGLIYEANNLNDLAKKILTLLNDKELRNKLSENGYSYVIEKYDYQNIIKKIEEIIYI
jgi:glycosyltransferase involved in cell wall biosynthesis